MRMLIRLLSLGLLGFLGYTIFEAISARGFSFGRQQGELGNAEVGEGHPGQGRGVPVEVLDSGGEVRTHIVGRGVIHPS